jgi:polysaccharide export outer membrane protein
MLASLALLVFGVSSAVAGVEAQSTPAPAAIASGQTAVTGGPAAPPSTRASATAGAPKTVISAPAALSSDYRIGPEDVLNIVFWRDEQMSVEVMVRPDGKISIPLLNDVQAAGLTPDQLRLQLIEGASKFIEEPNASVVVKTVNSRKVFITGMVARPGTYPLIGVLNVLQLIAQAGGLLEYADSKNIVIIRVDGGNTASFKFNFKDVVRQKNVKQNIELRPGDTVVVQ